MSVSRHNLKRNWIVLSHVCVVLNILILLLFRHDHKGATLTNRKERQFQMSLTATTTCIWVLRAPGPRVFRLYLCQEAKESRGSKTWTFNTAHTEPPLQPATLTIRRNLDTQPKASHGATQKTTVYAAVEVHLNVNPPSSPPSCKLMRAVVPQRQII